MHLTHETHSSKIVFNVAPSFGLSTKVLFPRQLCKADQESSVKQYFAQHSPSIWKGDSSSVVPVSARQRWWCERKHRNLEARWKDTFRLLEWYGKMRNKCSSQDRSWEKSPKPFSEISLGGSWNESIRSIHLELALSPSLCNVLREVTKLEPDLGKTGSQLENKNKTSLVLQNYSWVRILLFFQLPRPT